MTHKERLYNIGMQTESNRGLTPPQSEELNMNPYEILKAHIAKLISHVVSLKI